MVNQGWQITGWYLLVLLCLIIPMKLLSLRRSPPGGRGELCSFLLAPSLCAPSWMRRKKIDGIPVRLFGSGLVFFVVYSVIYHFRLVIPAGLSPWLQGYLAIVPFWLMLEALEVLVQLVWLPTGYRVPAINNNPILSQSIGEFWGRRWNRLIGDWLHQVCYLPFFRQPGKGLFVAFTVSGGIHELLVSLPSYLVYRTHLWGMMTVYFLIQYFGIIVERRWLTARPGIRRLFSWFVILVPSPLVLNSGTLRIFHMV